MVDPNVHAQLRRAMNADRRRQFDETGRRLALICECGDLSCHRTVVLSVEEYDSMETIIHPDHRQALREAS
jgi:hypothetical protein